MNKAASIYIHIPYCISKCKYCDFFSIENHNSLVSNEYVNALCNEIRFRKTEYKISEIKTVYIGGGTPSLLTQNQLKKICDSLFENVVLLPDYEFTIEVNPDDVSEKLLKSFEENKINRISCGIQSLNNDALAFVGRRADFNQNISALECFKKFWKKDLSLDLICGLPYETEQSFLQGLNTLVSYNPTHISMYSLTIEEETPLGKLVNSGKIEYDFDKSDELWLLAKTELEKNGYFHYEVSNFAKENKECKHNLVYWNHEDYIGIGCGGTGTVYKKNGEGIRWTNKNNLHKYISFWNESSDFSEIPEIKEKIDLETSKFEFFMMGLRKVSGISKNHYESVFGEPILPSVISVFEKWQKQNQAEIIKSDDDVIYTLGKNGILFLNSFLEEII